MVEIGSGMGDTTADIAAAHPDIDYLAIEVHTPGVGSLLRQIGERALTNVRVIQHDAVEVMRDMVPPESLVRHPHLLPRPLAQEAPPQAPSRCSRTSPRCSPRAWRPAATCTSPPTGQDYAEQALAVLAATPGLRNAGDGFVARAGDAAGNQVRAPRL